MTIKIANLSMALMLGMIAGCGDTSTCSESPEQKSAKKTAEIGNRVITTADYERQLELKYNLILAGRAIRAPMRQFDAQKLRSQFMSANRGRIGVEVISKALVLAAAEKSGNKVSQEYVEHIRRQMAKSVTGDEKAFDVLVKVASERGFAKELEQLIADEAVSLSFMSKISGGISYQITESEIDARLAADKAFNGTVAASNAVIFATASNVLSQARSGADFAALARKYSACEDRDDGGDLGRVIMTGEGSICNSEPSYTSTIMLNEGAVSDILQTSFGIEIVQVYGEVPQDKPTDPISKMMRHIGWPLLKARPLLTREQCRSVLTRERVQEIYGEASFLKLLKIVPVKIVGYDVPEDYFHEMLNPEK